MQPVTNQKARRQAVRQRTVPAADNGRRDASESTLCSCTSMSLAERQRHGWLRGSAFALLCVSGRAVTVLMSVMMVVFLPFVAIPIAVAVPIAVAMPSRRHDDDRGRRDHDRWRTDVNADANIRRMRKSRSGDAHTHQRCANEKTFHLIPDSATLAPRVGRVVSGHYSRSQAARFGTLTRSTPIRIESFCKPQLHLLHMEDTEAASGLSLRVAT